jgi:hypothetical protein
MKQAAALAGEMEMKLGAKLVAKAKLYISEPVFVLNILVALSNNCNTLCVR